MRTDAVKVLRCHWSSAVRRRLLRPFSTFSGVCFLIKSGYYRNTSDFISSAPTSASSSRQDEGSIDPCWESRLHQTSSGEAAKTKAAPQGIWGATALLRGTFMELRKWIRTCRLRTEDWTVFMFTGLSSTNLNTVVNKRRLLFHQMKPGEFPLRPLLLHPGKCFATPQF